MAGLDSSGVPIPTRFDREAAFYRDGQDLLLSARYEAAGTLNDAIAADSGFALEPAPPPRVQDVETAATKATIGEAGRIAKVDGTGATERTAALAGFVEAGTLETGSVVPATWRAALAFEEEDYPACTRIFEPVVAEAVRICGRGAQREIVEEALLQAFFRSVETAKARSLLARRLHRPLPLDTRSHGLPPA